MSGSSVVLDSTADGTASLSTSSTVGVSSTALRGFSFSTPSDLESNISGLTLGLSANTAATYSLTIELYAASGNVPTGSALSSASISIALTTTPTYYAFSAAQLGTVATYDLSVSAGYALVFRGPTGSFNIRWIPLQTAAAPSTDLGFSYGALVNTTNNGSSWSTLSISMSLQLEVTATCYLRGTRILTEHGERPVEQLREGDLVATRFGGLRAIRWIGTQVFHGRLVDHSVWPVRIAPGALGAGVPRAELLLSPGHAVLVGEHLVHAAALVNDVTITQPAHTGTIEYHHLDLDGHDCVMANGAWAESYFDDHNRDRFHNAESFHARFPGHTGQRQPTCLPIVTATDPMLPALRARIAPRLTADQLSPDPDIHFLIDGQRVEATAVGESAWQVAVPPAARTLRLRSRVVRPSMIGPSPDDRRLGVMLWGIEAACGDRQIAIPIDHPWLGSGLHEVERRGDHAWRWTTGDAAIPVRLLGETGAPVLLTVRGYHPPLCFAGAEKPGDLAAAA